MRMLVVSHELLGAMEAVPAESRTLAPQPV